MKPWLMSPNAPALGPLERQVMDHLWERGRPARVREVHDFFEASLAYTTLMTTLDRLHKKGLLERTKNGRAFVYAPRVSREGLERGLLSRWLEALLGRGSRAARPALSTFVETVSQSDRRLLEDLARLVAEERRKHLRKDPRR
jgi:predicted transcriptional regulator